MKRLKGSVKGLYRTWYQDGIGDLSQAAIFGFIALFFYLDRLLITHFPWNLIFQLVFFAVIILGGLYLRRLVNLLKERITYPRTGYVQFRQNRELTRQKRLYRVVIGLAIGSMVGLILGFLPGESIQWPFVFLGLGVGLIFYYVAWYVDVMRYYLHTAITILTGAALAFFPLGELNSLMIFFAVTALAQLVSGLITLYFFIRKNPVQEMEINQ